eukprot:CAMPEP_0114990302 /NCGR_PEP_ID=MMETSP0216-20121206/10710_1 /TAXON_ID=223996 /ORGANISM="Protocruzia adherens, Strain Boccale" /LENGTH=533 /DNA_ID=CAMNT_0002353441 /DNA_START=45 /DNA_END=1646 /DNA_ORIENTATION=-
MVVLSIGIVTKEGKILVCRQFVDISRSKIEGMYTSFLKLLSSSSSQQHTYVETAEVRYIYQPIESLYLCLITNKTSNILQDIDTLRMSHRVLQEYCREGFQEVYVIKNSFELILAFDDLISLGYRESVTMSQVATYLEMESSEEKFHKMLMKARENEAKEAAKKHALEAQRRRAQGLDPSPGGIEGKTYDADRDALSGTSTTGSSSSYEPTKTTTSSSSSSSFNKTSTTDTTKTSKAPKKSMKLKGKTSKQEGAVLAAVDNESGADLFQETTKESEEAKESPQMDALLEPVHVEVEERITCEINADGELQSLEVKGKLFLSFHDPHKTKVLLKMKPLDSRKFNVRPHPCLNRTTWEEERGLTTEDSEGFPHGERILALKYKVNKTGEKDLPFSIQFWGSKSGGKSVITLECEFNGRQKFMSSLNNITFGFPLDDSIDPEIKNVENGSPDYDSDSSTLKWNVPVLDKEQNDSAKIEFTTTTEVEAIFPITVNFSSEQLYANFELEEAVNLGGDQSLNVKMIKELAADNFTIVSD